MLVKMMNGSIEVDSQMGSGSTFRVTLHNVETAETDAPTEIQSQEPDLDRGTEPDGSTWSPASLDSDVRAHLPELARELDGYRDTCSELAGTMSINEIDTFAESIKALAESYEYPPAAEWADELATQSSLFDTVAIEKTLSRFEQLVEEIRTMSAETDS